jgi:hypothetical protein
MPTATQIQTHECAPSERAKKGSSGHSFSVAGSEPPPTPIQVSTSGPLQNGQIGCAKQADDGCNRPRMMKADDADNGGDWRVGAHAGGGVALVGVDGGYVMIWGCGLCGCRLRAILHDECGRVGEGPKMRAELHRSSESSGPCILVWLRNWRPARSSGKSRSLYFLIGCLVLRPFRYPSNLHRIVFGLCVHVPPRLDLVVRHPEYIMANSKCVSFNAIHGLF